MNATVTMTVSSGLPKVPRGSVVVLRDGSEFVVKKQTATTLTLVPRRWWHKVPWWAVFAVAFILGAFVGQLVWHWWG